MILYNMGGRRTTYVIDSAFAVMHSPPADSFETPIQSRFFGMYKSSKLHCLKYLLILPILHPSILWVQTELNFRGNGKCFILKLTIEPQYWLSW